MSNQKFLTVAMRIEDATNRGEFVDEIFQRFMEQQARDGVEIFAASWTDLFSERDELEARVERLERGDE